MTKSNLTRVLERLQADTELAQAVVRIPIGGLVGTYTALYGRGDPIGANTPVDIAFMPSYLAYFGLAGLLLVMIWIKPGHLWYRRVFGIFLDLLALWGILLLGGQVMLPALLGLVWIIVGNGIRFGYLYLILAMGGGLTIIAYLYHFNPFWHANPIMSFTFAGTLVVAPVYALALMGQLRRANAAVRLANAEKSKLLAQASHDLRHPLHALRLYANQLGQSALSPLQGELLEKIQLSTANANQMLQQFLDRSIIESGILSINKTSFSLAAMVDELVIENESWLAAARLDVSIATKSTVITTDRNVLRTLVQGLISNAVKYAPSGRLLIGARRRRDGIYLEVHDDGGHKASTMARRGDIQHLPPSAGVGLALGQHLAQQAGYDLTFEVKPDRGFVARIGPLPMSNQSQRLSASSPPRSTPLSGAHVSLDIQEPVLRARLSDLLGTWGCVITPLSKVDEGGSHPNLAHICDTWPVKLPPTLCVLLSDESAGSNHNDRALIIVPTNGFSQLRSVLLARLLETPA
jgi:signal transduction histidine kinase